MVTYCVLSDSRPFETFVMLLNKDGILPNYNLNSFGYFINYLKKPNNDFNHSLFNALFFSSFFLSNFSAARFLFIEVFEELSSLDDVLLHCPIFEGCAYISVIIFACFEYSPYCSSNNLPASSFRADSGLGYIKRHLTVYKKNKI